MGYRIVYGKNDFVEKSEGKSHLRSMTAGFALAFVILTRIFWPQGSDMLRRILIPAPNAAFNQLQEDLQAGEPLSGAVTAFCRTIVEEAVGQAD